MVLKTLQRSAEYLQCLTEKAYYNSDPPELSSDPKVSKDNRAQQHSIWSLL